MISVIIPTYNRNIELKRSIESVINQTYKDIEIIVVDDGSSDLTNEMVKSIDDERIKYYRHRKNFGACAARNTGIKHARGEYIAFQDSDDDWEERKLEIELEALKQNDADVVFCKMNQIIDNKIIDIVSKQYKVGFINNCGDVIGIGTQSLIGKTEVFRKNLFDIRLPRFQELELLLRLIKKEYKVYCCDRILVSYYNDCYNSISGNPNKLLSACKLIKRKHKDIREEFPNTCKAISSTLFKQYYRKELSEKEKKEILVLAVWYLPTIKNIVKFCLIKLRLYSVVKKIMVYIQCFRKKIIIG